MYIIKELQLNTLRGELINMHVYVCRDSMLEVNVCQKPHSGWYDVVEDEWIRDVQF